MSPGYEQVNVIEMLARHEEAMSRLYSAYLKIFPDRKDLWYDLAQEELEHAKWLRDLVPQIEAGSVYFSEKRFRREAIQTSLEYVEVRLAKAQKEKIDIKEALSTALDIEKAIIESRYFEVVQGDSGKLKQTFGDLLASTKAHRDKVQKALNEIG
jgi:rubrerythrin